MSLMKKRVLSEKQKAAARANGRRTRGAATAEGRARIRDANLVHGQYSGSDDFVLTALGESREEFEKLRQSIREEWPLTDPSHQELLEKLAVAEWRLRRFERRQEDIEMQQALDTINKKPWSVGTVSALMSMSAERAAFRQVARLIKLLMEAEETERKRLL